jgi:hypothetical protein
VCDFPQIAEHLSCSVNDSGWLHLSLVFPCIQPKQACPEGLACAALTGLCLLKVTGGNEKPGLQHFPHRLCWPLQTNLHMMPEFSSARIPDSFLSSSRCGQPRPLQDGCCATFMGHLERNERFLARPGGDPGPRGCDLGATSSTAFSASVNVLRCWRPEVWTTSSFCG